MIKLEQLTKAFGEKVLFRDLNLEIASGEFVAFSGVSGCGKTTLLNMIGSLEPTTQGRILVDGIDVGQRKNQLKYFADTVGFLFQNFALIEDKTVGQNLALVRKGSRSGISIEDALARVGLADKRDSKVFTLSGGEQQRVALARLMIKKCSLILADEPTGSLDRENADAVMDILHELNAAGKTVVIVTHDDAIKRNIAKVVRL